MHYYHTECGELPTIEKLDYGGYKFDDVLGDDRFRQKRQALVDYRLKLRELISEGQQALRDSDENMDIETGTIW